MGQMRSSRWIARIAAGAFAVSAATVLAGCGGFSDPETTVTVEVTGVSGALSRDRISERLADLVDASPKRVATTYTNTRMTVRLSPVTDVQAFADKIDCDTVTEVAGRTIRLTASP